MGTYTLSATVTRPYAEAVDATRAALADQGFGVLTEIDLRGHPEGQARRRHPAAGHPRRLPARRSRTQAIQADPSVAAMLPCNVVVRSVDEGTYRRRGVRPGRDDAARRRRVGAGRTWPPTAEPAPRRASPEPHPTEES